MGRNNELANVESALTKFEGLLAELTKLLEEWKEEEGDIEYEDEDDD
jgi:hypothetical protein